MFSKSLKDFFKNPVITLPSVIMSIFAMLSTRLILGSNYFKILENGGKITNYEDMSTEISRISSYFLLFVLILFFIAPYITCWFGVMCKNVVDGMKPKFGESFQRASKFYWRVLGVFVLKFLIFLGLFIVFVIAMIPFSNYLVDHAATPPLFILIVLIAIIVFIFFGISLVPVEYVLIYDDLKIGDAISSGFKLGTRRFFRIFGFSLLVGIIGAILNEIFKNQDFVKSIIAAYLGLLLPVYIFNLARDNSNPVEPEFANNENAEENITSENIVNNLDNNNHDDDKDNNDNNFIV